MARLREGEAGDDDACGRIISAATLAGPLGTRMAHANDLFSDTSPLSPEGYRRLVALDEAGTIAGFADYDPGRCHIRYLFIDPGHQGSGLGTALINAVAVRLDAQYMTLNCFAANDRALSWYLAHGFEIIDGGMTELAGKSVVEINLRREISA